MLTAIYLTVSGEMELVANKNMVGGWNILSLVSGCRNMPLMAIMSVLCSVLLDDEWFLTSAQDALHKLLEGWNRQVSSPTASLSAQSVSSFRSHGSE